MSSGEKKADKGDIEAGVLLFKIRCSEKASLVRGVWDTGLAFEIWKGRGHARDNRVKVQGTGQREAQAVRTSAAQAGLDGGGSGLEVSV